MDHVMLETGTHWTSVSLQLAQIKAVKPVMPVSRTKGHGGLTSPYLLLVSLSMGICSLEGLVPGY